MAIAKTPDIKYPQSQYEFFVKLEPVLNSIHYFFKIAEMYDVYILTRPSIMNPLCYTEKRIWVENYLGLEFCKKLIICPDKSLLKGQYLIDDVKWDGFEGEQILFGQDPFMTWSNVHKYLKNKHKV